MLRCLLLLLLLRLVRSHRVFVSQWDLTCYYSTFFGDNNIIHSTVRSIPGLVQDRGIDLNKNRIKVVI